MTKQILVACVFSFMTAPHLQAQKVQLPVEGRSGGVINDVDQSRVALHAATPFLESSSMMLADIDLEKVDFAAIASWLNEVAGTPDSIGDVETMNGFLASLRGAGVSHVYVTAATRSPIDGGPIVIIPCQNPPVVSGLATALTQQAPEGPPQKVHVGDKVVVVGPAAAVDRVVARQGAERPDLILPTKANDLLDHTIVISLPTEARKELSALWPVELSLAPLPEPIFPRQIASDILRIAVTFRLPPEPEMMVRIETANASAADRVKGLIDNALTMTGELKSLIEVNVDVANVNLVATPDAFFQIVSAVGAPAREKAMQMRKSNSMKQIMLAFHNYASNEKELPPRVFTDSEGRPLMSWRIAILPYIDQQALYRELRLDQAWDSEDNRQLTSMLIMTYCDDLEPSVKTTIRTPVFPGSLWDGDGPPKTFRDVQDGLSNTIAIIDAPPSAAIDWANPEPWILSKDDPMSDVFGDRDSVRVGMLDGAIIVLEREGMTNEKLKAMLTIAGGEVIEP